MTPAASAKPEQAHVGLEFSEKSLILVVAAVRVRQQCGAIDTPGPSDQKGGMTSMSRLCLCACLTLLLGCPALALADPITFAVTDTGRFGTLNLGTGGFTVIGGVQAGGYLGLGNLADGSLVAVTGFNNFVRIDRSTGAVTTVGPTGITVAVEGSLSTGDQFAFDTFNRLYRINPATGAATLVGPTSLPAITGAYGNALAGDATSLYYIFEQTGSSAVTSSLYRINPLTGGTTLIGPTGTRSLVGAGFADGTLYAYSGDFPVTTGHRIFTIDTATGAATGGSAYSQNFEIFSSNSGQAAVPEPSAWTLFGLGALGIVGCAWQRKKAAADH